MKCRVATQIFSGGSMDPAKVALRWFQERFGREQLIETTIWEMWNEGSKWYVVARSRTTSNPRSADNPYQTLEIDGLTGEVIPRQGRCPHLMPLSYFTKDFLPFRYVALTCGWCVEREPMYQEFKEKADEVAKHLQDNDHGTRVEGASLLVELGEEVIEPSGTRPDYHSENSYDEALEIDGSRYAIAGSRTMNEVVGKSMLHHGHCYYDGSKITGNVSRDFLKFRLTTLGCGLCVRKDSKKGYFEEKFGEAGRALRDSDHVRRVEAGPIIVNLVEEGAGVIGPSPRTELLGHPQFDTR